MIFYFYAMEKQPVVYILSNKKDGVLYVGVTSDIQKRIFEHKRGIVKGFTQKYGAKNLVYYEVFDDMYSAIEREKQLKSGSRQKKVSLIEKENPHWNDLFEFGI